MEDFTSTESGSGGSTTSGKSIKWLDRGLTVEDLNLNVASIITARLVLSFFVWGQNLDN